MGKYLCDTYPDLFNKGAWLLAHCGYKEIFEPVKTKLDELLSLYDLEVKTKMGYSANPGYTIDMSRKMFELIDILIKTSPEVTKNILHEITGTHRENYLRVHFAFKLLGIGDISGLDMLMEEIKNKEFKSGLASYLEQRLSNNTYELYFSWYKYEAMYEWYQKNRLNLQWDDEGYRILLTHHWL